MFEITEDTYIDRIWMYGRAGDFDCLGMVMREPSGPWIARFRFRYHVDDLVGAASSDIKRWYTSVADDGSDGALERLWNRMEEAIQDAFVAMGEALPLEVVPVGGGREKLVRAFHSLEHATVVIDAAG